MNENKRRITRKRNHSSARKRWKRFTRDRRESWQKPSAKRSSFRRSLLSVLRMPFKVLTGTAGAVFGSIRLVVSGIANLWGHRSRKYLLQGLPAILVAVTSIWLAIAANGAKDELPGEYQIAAITAAARGDYDASRLYYERLETLDGGTDRTRYELAVNLALTGKIDRASGIMQTLAPDDANGYGLAHLWRAERILAQADAFENREQLELAYKLLTRAQAELPESSRVNLRLAQFLVAVNRYDEAVRFMRIACRFDRKLHYELGMLLASLQRVDEAKDAFRDAMSQYESLLLEDADDEDARLHLATIHINLDNFKAAVDILRDGLARNPDGPFSRIMAHAFVRRFDQLQSQEGSNAAMQLELLRLALEHDPDSQAVLNRIIGLGESSEEDLQATKEVLETLLASGYANAFAHFVLGCKAWEADETDSAIFHLERAYHLDDSLGPVANNLAWVLSQDETLALDTRRLERALALMNSVVNEWPDVASYRDTRGQVLVKLERWQEAFDDLEFALVTMEDNPQVHLAMALTYENLKQNSLAEKHRKIAKALVSDPR
jgi:tetratricopeptide (TPR) repeat protein